MSQAQAETWIKAGYKLLAKEGLEGVKVEPLARIVQLNKSGFYHYFGSMKVYLKSLFQYHIRMAHEIAGEIKRCENIDPDLLTLVVRHKAFFLVESQLMVKCNQTNLEGCDEAGKIVGKALLSLVRKTIQLPEDDVALAYLNIILNFCYARINSENISYKFLHTLAQETTTVLKKVIEERIVSVHKA